MDKSTTNLSDKLDATKFLFSIKTILLYNPTLKPDKAKPQEEDIQDAKLLYYYPDETQIEEKRNQQGLTEGNLMFWNTFGGDFLKFPSEPVEGGSLYLHVISLDKYLQVINKFEDNFWLNIIIQPLAKEATYRNLQQDYLSPDTNNYEDCYFSKHNLLSFINHFYRSFRYFYGDFSDLMCTTNKSKMSERFAQIFPDFIQSYIRLNAIQNKVFSILKYAFGGMHYAAIEKKNFLSMQYFVNVLLSIESSIEHVMLFYSGLFIYSSLPLHHALFFFDYFFLSGAALEIDVRKIASRMAVRPVAGNPTASYGFISRTSDKNGFIFGPHAGEEEKGSIEAGFFPEAFIDGKKYSLTAKSEKKLLVVFFHKNQGNSLEAASPIKFSLLSETIAKNYEKTSANLDKFITRSQQSEDTYRMMYFNNMNMAVKVSNKFNIMAFDSETVRMAIDIKAKLESDEEMLERMERSNNFWVLGFKGNERVVLALFPVALSLAKIEDEKKKLIDFFFSNIYI